MPAGLPAAVLTLSAPSDHRCCSAAFPDYQNRLSQHMRLSAILHSNQRGVPWISNMVLYIPNLVPTGQLCSFCLVLSKALDVPCLLERHTQVCLLYLWKLPLRYWEQRNSHKQHWAEPRHQFMMYMFEAQILRNTAPGKTLPGPALTTTRKETVKICSPAYANILKPDWPVGRLRAKLGKHFQKLALWTLTAQRPVLSSNSFQLSLLLFASYSKPWSDAQRCQKSCNPIPPGTDPVLALTFFLSLSLSSKCGWNDLPPRVDLRVTFVLCFGGKLKVLVVTKHRQLPPVLLFAPF